VKQALSPAVGVIINSKDILPEQEEAYHVLRFLLLLVVNISQLITFI
jgi:hypothetical protein